MLDEDIYGTIWVEEIDLATNTTEAVINSSTKENYSINSDFSDSESQNKLDIISVKLNDDNISQSFGSFEGESEDNLDISLESTPRNIEDQTPMSDSSYISTHSTHFDVPFPKDPCFSVFSDKASLQFYGQIIQIFSNIATIRKNRFGVLLSDRLVLFKKQEHHVSKLQIPIDRIIDIYWFMTSKCSNKNDCNRFIVKTSVHSYKFQCSSHNNAGLWINRIGKLLIDRGEKALATKPPLHILKAEVIIDKVKGKRIFTIEPQYTLAYYECEEDFGCDIAMHRVQLRSSGVRREPGNNVCLNLITSYRRYKLFFETQVICDQWFVTLSSIIQKAITSRTIAQNVKTGEEIMAELHRFLGNNHCADCGSENPEWASINLFITLCTNCSGIHRSLGCNISLIQGILSDESIWQDSNVVRLFAVIGNKNANDFFLKTYVDTGLIKDQRKFLYDKYVNKQYIGRLDLIYDKYNDQQALNDELMKVVRTIDVKRTMELFQIGADINYIDANSGMDVFTAAKDNNQFLQLTFLKNQSKNIIRDWRNELFRSNLLFQGHEKPIFERMFFCSINGAKLGSQSLVIGSVHFQILTNDLSKSRICKVYFKNICLIREKRVNDTDQIFLIIIVRETEFSSGYLDVDRSINIIELFSCNLDQSFDVIDFKNEIAPKMCPSFQLKTAFDCMGWVVLSKSTEEWQPYLLILNSNRYLEFHNPWKADSDNTLNLFQLDLRKVQKIEELRENMYESRCSYKMYNLASICFVSSVIYHIRSDTKYAHEEYLDLFTQAWQKVDFSLSNQFLTKDNVPLAVHKMIQFMQLHVSTTEGPFRRVGSVRVAEKICNELMKDPGSFVLKDCTIYDVASALKLFFRKLDDPLLTKKLYRSWITAVRIQDFNEQLLHFKTGLEKLPLVNYKTLRMLIFLLFEIVLNKNVTQMDAYSLSTSFNTCLLISGSNEQSFSQENLQILPFLMNNYKYLFDVSDLELKKEEIIRQGLWQFSNEKVMKEYTLLRQIYIDIPLEGYLKSDINYERVDCNVKSQGKNKMFTKQVAIEQTMTSESLKPQIFKEHCNMEKVMLFEVREIDSFHMQRLIYPLENLFNTINFSEMHDTKSSSKWIYKIVKKNLSLNYDNLFKSFRCWAYFSCTNKNKIFVELNETGQLNIWKDDKSLELFYNFTIKNLLLYVSFEQGKKLIVFNAKKIYENNLSRMVHNLTFKTKCYTFINFLNQSDYESFLEFFDMYKIDSLIPLECNPRIPKRI